jgi:hypothetical protein
MTRDKLRQISDDIEALFSTERGSFYGVSPAVAKSEAIKRIKKNIATLAEGSRVRPEQDLREYLRFSELSKQEQERIYQQAKEHGTTVKQAAEERFSGASRN